MIGKAQSVCKNSAIITPLATSIRAFQLMRVDGMRVFFPSKNYFFSIIISNFAC